MTTSPEAVPAPPLLEACGIVKTFPGVRALGGVSCHLERGEVLAIMGENGAGKSTLMKILAGVQCPDDGQLKMDGKTVRISSVPDALGHGIALIHQELNLASNLSVGANLFLGREPSRRGFIDEAAVRREAMKYLAMVGLDVDPATLVEELSIGRQQMVEIAKALSINARVLIMDEPTSSLSAREADALFAVIHALRDRGVGIVYISHRLAEVKALADRVTVLRDGENAGELRREEITHDRMISLMVGRDLSSFYARTENATGEVILEAKELRTPAHPTRTLNFSLRRGEIVGLAGLVGSGRTEVLTTLFGATPAVGGEIRVAGNAVTLDTPRTAVQQGLALAPEDRKQHGLILEMTVRENLSLATLERNASRGLVNRPAEMGLCQDMIARLRVKTPGPEQVVRYLSGGNQQKVVLGKWLAMDPRILLLDEPTRGIDVGAKHEIYALMESLARQGMAILFVSSEMEEMLGMADRVLVMHEGHLAGELSRAELSEEALMHLATGQSDAAA
ncbi:MAG TPA: sugar ABC transporter ATP-binding protein [Verrucomicrobiales bacterium]|nr:sugar ABC transporter ATP-binding protein [Verrucomicrobiae bacterium]MCP5554046.1 sugar ABC transporter ATP-binding protein [Akkermansiaceae bacterium]HRX55599.1 sugar ABC transporter ATP-binding protein [Verrucomicrobiales bacterium]